MADSWCTIESDPGVFTELIERFGVKGVQVEELYGLDEDEFQRHQPIYGLIFLFKYTGETDDRPSISPDDEPELFFANQVINNACATQAILSVLLNQPSLDLGETLNEFRGFTREFSSDLKGLAISNSDSIRTAHNSFARAEPFVMEGSKTATEKDDVFHFVAYIPFGNKVYELDGLKPGPVLLGEGEDWLSVARPAIRSRIERYSSSEIRFNLMAIIRNRKDVLTEKIASKQVELDLVTSAMAGQSIDASKLSFTLAEDAAGQQAQQSTLREEIEDMQAGIRQEESKFENWKMENTRRKHNYIPFVVNLFQMLAEGGHLQPMVEKAQKARRESASQGDKGSSS